MRSIWGFCLFLGATAGAHAGVVVQISEKAAADSTPKPQQVVYAQDGLLRVDKLDEQGQVRDSTLIRDGAIWEINAQKKTYRKIDKNSMAALHSETNDRMQAALQSMPADKRAMFEQRMKAMQQETHDYELTDSGRSEHVGPYSCEVWQAVRDGKPTMEYCVVPRGGLTGGDELVTATHKASSIAADVLSAAPQMSRSISPVYKMYGKLDGFPVLTRHIYGGQASDETIVTAIDKKSLPADQFAVPKGYTEAALGKSDAGN